MEELLQNNFFSYLGTTFLVGLWAFYIIWGTFRKTKKMDRTRLKALLRIGVSSVLICIWTFGFVLYLQYPISLAFYEYKNNCIEEKIGVVESIKGERNDRVLLIIDDIKYTAIYNGKQPFIPIGPEIDKGDVVKIKFGKKSKFIFEICEETD